MAILKVKNQLGSWEDIPAIVGKTGAAGASIVWRGAYAAGTAYVVNDVVSYNGSSYICVLASIGNLPTNATYWTLIAQKGDNTTAASVTNTPAGNIAATNVQAALNELDTEKAAVAQEAWIVPTLLNSHTADTGYPIAYMKDTIGFVHIKGKVVSTGATEIFTLPVGYRPLITGSFFGARSGFGTIAVAEVNGSGTVTFITAANGNKYDMTGITFKAEQ